MMVGLPPIGNVVQISPDIEDKRYGGCYMVVKGYNEVRDFVTGEILVPSKNGVESVVLELPIEEVENIGPSVWTAE